jgi:catechol 2,3-dioxygenase-like lactoylglutathione lyase family enzyme
LASFETLGSKIKMISDAVKKQLRLTKTGQIGYVITDINKTIAYYKNTFGISPWMLLDARPEPCIEKGKEVHPLLRIALAYQGSIQLELIQVVEGESFHLNHVKEGREEAHHLGFMVQGINKRLDSCREMGIGIVQRGTIRASGIVVDYAYLDTVDQTGIIIELLQWRVGPVPLPMNRLVFSFLCWVGSRTLLKGRVIK